MKNNFLKITIVSNMRYQLQRVVTEPYSKVSLAKAPTREISCDEKEME